MEKNIFLFLFFIFLIFFYFLHFFFFTIVRSLSPSTTATALAGSTSWESTVTFSSSPSWAIVSSILVTTLWHPFAPLSPVLVITFFSSGIGVGACADEEINRRKMRQCRPRYRRGGPRRWWRKVKGKKKRTKKKNRQENKDILISFFLIRIESVKEQCYSYILK